MSGLTSSSCRTKAAGPVLGLILLLGACASPAASPAGSITPAPATPGPTASVSTPTANPLPSPTPTASSRPLAWSSLTWTRADKAFIFSLLTARSWQGRYLGIGQVGDTYDQTDAAFFTSADGLTWQVTQRLGAGPDLLPSRLLAVNDGLLAVFLSPGGGAQLWHSDDGNIWQQLASPVWQQAWTGADSRLQDLAAGPAGIVAVGVDAAGALSLFSSDGGRSWEPAQLAAGSGAEARSAVARDSGFVAVGVIGGRWDAGLHQVLGGRSAAWLSADGRNWHEAEIAPAPNAGTPEVDRLAFSAVYAALDGLVAVATDNSSSVPGFPAQAWASVDGVRWEPLGPLGQVVPRGSLVGDGTRFLILDPGDWSPFDGTPWPGYRSGWTSFDGQTWTPVACSGQLMDQESFYGWWLTDDGLIFVGNDQVWAAQAS